MSGPRARLHPIRPSAPRAPVYTVAPARRIMAPSLLILVAALFGSAGNEGELLPSSNYSVILRHGSQADCPCFRIPCLVTTVETATTATLVLLVEARWSSSECYPISGPKPPLLPPSPPALALVSSTDAVRPSPSPILSPFGHALKPAS